MRPAPLALAVSLTASLAACADADLGRGAFPDGLTAASPDGRLAVTFALTPDSALTYALARDGEPLLLPAPLGFTEVTWGELTRGFVLASAKTRRGRETYDLPWGEVARVDAGFGESLLAVEHPATGARFTVTARVFDDGLGLRYDFPAQGGRDSLRVLEEHTRFRVGGDPLVNWGPGDWNSYENRLELTRLSEIDARKYDDRAQLIKRVVPNNAVMTPATLRLDNGTHVTLHEAALVDYPEMTLGVEDDGFASVLAGSPNRRAKAVRALPFSSPWRTVQVEDRAVDLLANTLVLNLNPPNELGDVSWFEPKTYAGVWWEMFLGKGTWDYASSQSAAGSAGLAESGESRHSANTANVKRYIDFCADNDIGGLLVEGWNTGWEVWLDSAQRLDAFDFVTPYPDYDLREVVAYGKARGVDIVMHHETSGVPERYEEQLDTAFALMRELDLHVVKSGYVGNFPNGEWHHGQYGVRHYRHVFETAARYQVAVNPHEPVKPTGERRTLPNAISGEGARGMEYNAFGDYTQVNQPSHLPSLVYTRCLAGPFDYTPGIFNLEMEGYKGPDEEVLSTLGKQLGAYVVVYAPIQMVADLPEHYVARDPATAEVTLNGEPVDPLTLDDAGQRSVRQSAYHPAMRFIREMATNWDDTYPLAGELGAFAVVARKVRGEDRYFVGGVNGEDPRAIAVPLDFLPAGRSYELTLYRDADDADYRDNKTALEIERRFVTAADSLTVGMAVAGGFGGVLELGVAE